MIHGDRTLTYARAQRAGQPPGPRPARGCGVRPESLVGHLRRALARDGGGGARRAQGGRRRVALDPAYPRERLASIIDDARLRRAAHPGVAAAALPAARGASPSASSAATIRSRRRARRTRTAASIARQPDLRHLHLGLDGPAQGDPGHAPGVLQPPRLAARRSRRWRPGARTVQFATFGFCVSFQEMFSSWCSGGTLVLADEMTRRDIAGLARFLEEQRDRAPAPAVRGAQAPGRGGGGPGRLPARLREVITAGEQLQVTPAVRALFERLPGCTLSNQYGASETHVVSALTLAGDPAGVAGHPAGGPADRQRRASTCWTRVWSRCPSGVAASCTRAAPACRAAI